MRIDLFSDVFSHGKVLKSSEFENAHHEMGTDAIIANNGEPINLQQDSLNDEISDFMYADILAGVIDRKSTRLNSSHSLTSRMPSSA